MIAIVFLFYYAMYSWNIYTMLSPGNMTGAKESVKQTVLEGKTIPFVEGSLHSYLYFMYTELNSVQRK